MTHSLPSLKLSELVLNSLDTLSDVRIKVDTVYSKPKPSLLGTSSVVNTFLIKITSFSFNYIVAIIVCIAFESSVINLI
jgi:hypothetical protein